MRWRVARIAVTLGALVTACGVTEAPGSRGFYWIAEAIAQDSTDVATARKLFAEALSDETAQRYAAALQKFERVRTVRDTQAVRYRIATCLEALGRLRAALEAYTAASIAAGNDTESVSIARASREKIDALSGRVGRVVVRLSAQAPDDVSVKIDGEALAQNVIGTPVVVDPGVHEVTATGSHATPFRAQATVAEGGTTTIDVTIEGPRHAPPLPPMDTLPPAPAAAPPKSAPAPQEPSPPVPETGHSGRMTAGVVTVTAGGVLVAGSVVLLLVRHSDIETLNGACPGGVCPVSQEAQLDSTRSRALVEGPLAIGLGAAGLIAAGIGVALLAMPSAAHPTSTAPTSALVPWVDRDARGLSWSGRF